MQEIRSVWQVGFIYFSFLVSSSNRKEIGALGARRCVLYWLHWRDAGKFQVLKFTIILIFGVRKLFFIFY